MHVQHAQLDKTCQPFPQDDVETLLLTDVILPDEYDPDEANDLEQIQFWRHPRYFTEEESSIVRSYLDAVENGFCKAEVAVADLISFGLFPHELMLDMYAVFLRALRHGEDA